VKRNARYVSDHRERKRRGIVRVPIDIPPEVARAMVAAKWISEHDLQDRQKLSDAISDILDCWQSGTLIMNPLGRFDER
jgi:hypothetical protein